MTGIKGRSGGARQGAGRPKKLRPATTREYQDALDYLAAVVRGNEEPDSVRVQAARALLPYQAPRQRAPVSARTPKQLQHFEQLDAEAAAREEWRKRSATIRARHRPRED
jgi:hypothetical protein